MQPEKKRKFSFKQVFIILILIGVLVVGGGLTYLKSYFDSNRLKKLVIPKLEAALNRNIEVKDINLKFWRGVGIRVDEVKIANDQGFNEKYLAQVDEFTVDIALLPLLQREIKIEEVKLVKPIIQLAKNESGEANYKFRL
ncbi:AsmA family protein [Acetohalobium arabaticum]|uniref:AsmA family protein n=1 Tax=Acetohalobium arabaticum TaxID=28187 RepID=UPI000311008D|nr:AsmA family protein [Acetohalobium arabaticum]